ncbi:DNA-binding response OmpR family regulator [Sphingomonas sp. BE123]|jgi:DNA-binding response OmpR family regulator|uniref:response regulator n=1 Tax=unclassified Sphingomonas TaxID=196159 RepID=UPI002864362A|nr:response regulator [Sphingomonas sp. BE123]MDR6852494.1 DNA-binding response OmpR family regulator [Sphingomonas sp. BE123]
MRTILIVDDSRTNLHVLGARLGPMGYMVVLAESGREALDLIAGRGFDLVLLDMVMPGLSGLDVLAALRAAPDTADLPVIMVTARADRRGAVESLNAGADDHVSKPYDLDELHARIERTLERSGRLRELKRTVAALDARVAARAIELGELRSELALAHADQARMQVTPSGFRPSAVPLTGTSVF